MKLSDFIPIMIITAALIVNVCMGISNHIGFSVLMIRCIVVTIVFGIFGFIITKTVSNIFEYYRLKTNSTTENQSKKEKINSVLDIKVPPLDDKALKSIDYDNDNGFIEVNPANMGKYSDSTMD